MGKILESDRIDLGLLFFKIKTYWYYFVIIIPTLFLLGYFYAQSLPKFYGFKSVLQINPKRTGLPNLDELLIKVPEKINRERNIDDEIGIITSFDMIKKAMEKLDFDVSYFNSKEAKKNEIYNGIPIEVLVDNKSSQIVDAAFYVEAISNTEYKLTIDQEDVSIFDFKKNESLPEKIKKVNFSKKGFFGKPIKGENFSFIINQNNKGLKKGKNIQFVINNPIGLVKSFQSKLEAKVSKRESSLIVMKTEGILTAKETKFLDTLMNVVIEQNLIDKNLQGSKAVELISQQVNETKIGIDDLENRVQGFKSGKAVMNFEERARINLQNIDKYEETRNEAEIKLEGYRNIQQTLMRNEKNNQTLTPSTFNINDPTVNLYINNLNTLYQEKIANRNQTDENPNMIRINSQIANATASLKSYLDNNINIMNSTIARLNQKIGEARGLSTQIPLDTRTLDDLQRDLDYKKKYYNELLSKLSETKIGLQTNISDARVIESARREGNTPIKPNTKFIYLVSLMAGIFLPIAAIIVLDILNNKIISKGDLDESTKIPLLTMISHAQKSKAKIISVEDNKSVTAESFRALQLKLAYLSSNGSVSPHQTIGITSTINNEGKTFCAVNLSASFANSGKKTLLIDADMHKEQMHHYFKLQGAGLSEYLKGEAQLAQIIQPTQVPNLDVISSGQIISNPIALLENYDLDAFFLELKNRYQQIIIDIPPIGFVSDYFTLKNHIDTNLYIVRYNKSSRVLFNEINELYNSNKVKNFYIVLNDVRFAQMHEFQFKKVKQAYYNH